MPSICPICQGEGHTEYRSPGSPQICANNHRFRNIEGDPRKPPIYAVTDDKNFMALCGPFTFIQTDTPAEQQAEALQNALRKAEREI